MIKYALWAVGLCLLGVVSISSVHALEVQATGPAVVHLSKDAKTVLVGNPNHISVVLDNPRLLMVNAGQPGVSRLTVMGDDGAIIYDDMVVVAGAEKKYIKVRNACTNGGEGCQPTSMFYCGGMTGRCDRFHIQEAAVNGGGNGGETADVDAAMTDLPGDLTETGGM